MKGCPGLLIVLENQSLIPLGGHISQHEDTHSSQPLAMPLYRKNIRSRSNGPEAGRPIVAPLSNDTARDPDGHGRGPHQALRYGPRNTTLPPPQ